MLGKTTWIVPDGYMSDTKNGNFVSHEAICVLNLTEEDAVIHLEFFFEDKDPVGGFVCTCKAKRSNHIRLDKIKSEDGKTVPYNTPYSVLLTSSVPVIAQHSRMDVSQPEMTLMTTIAY